MDWCIIHIATKELLEQRFPSDDAANEFIDQMGTSFRTHYAAIPETTNDWTYRVLTEGLTKGDLRHIILPQVSVDEYVPGDPNTDNVVIAFFVKGVPEAVIPFRDFIMKCNGVIDVAYGESDTVPNASIVYAEMSRENFRYEHLDLMMDQVSLLTQLEKEDFSIRLPNTNQRFPFSKEIIRSYFHERTRKKNWMAQQKALDDVEKEDSPEGELTQESIVESFFSQLRNLD